MQAEGYVCTSDDLFNVWLGVAAGCGTVESVCADLVGTADPETIRGYLNEQLCMEDLPDLAQQPATARSKLDGLRAFYHLPRSVEPYFEVHAHNEHEAEKLLDRMRKLSAGDQSRAVQACQTMSRALWDALSGIYEKDCLQN